MPALPNVPKVLKIICTVKDSNDVRSLNRFFVQYTGAAPDNIMIDTFANSVAGAWTAHMQAEYDVLSALEQVEVIDLTSNVTPIGFVNPGTVGTRGGAPLSAAACAVIQMSILRRYRGGHPRQYLSAGVDADLSTRQQWHAAFQNELSNAYNSWVGAIIGAGWAGAGVLSPVNVSYFSGFTNHTYPSGRVRPVPTPRAVPVIDLITGIGVSLTLGSQRRRNLQSA